MFHLRAIFTYLLNCINNFCMVQRVLAEYHIILFFGDLYVRRHDTLQHCVNILTCRCERLWLVYDLFYIRFLIFVTVLLFHCFCAASAFVAKEDYNIAELVKIIEIFRCRQIFHCEKVRQRMALRRRFCGKQQHRAGYLKAYISECVEGPKGASNSLCWTKSSYHFTPSQKSYLHNSTIEFF